MAKTYMWQNACAILSLIVGKENAAIRDGVIDSFLDSNQGDKEGSTK